MNPNRRELLFGLMASTVNASTADTVDLFEARQGGYALYRIPGIVVTRAGTILVYAEARRNNGSDWDDMDILVRRSTDGGRSFSAPWTLPRLDGIVRNPVANERKQGQPEWRTYNNPVMIASSHKTGSTRHRAPSSTPRDPAVSLYVTSQILCEFYAVVTNGRRVAKPRTSTDALRAITAILGIVRVLPIPPTAVQGWMDLLRRHPVTGGGGFNLQDRRSHASQRHPAHLHGQHHRFSDLPKLTIVTP